MKRFVLILFVLCLCALPVWAGLSEGDDSEALRLENEALKNRLQAYEDPAVIAVFDVGTVTFEEVYAAYSELMEYYSAVYEAFGMEYAPDPDEALSLQMELARSLADQKLVDAYLEKSGAELLSAEDIRRIREDSQTDYDMIYQENLLYYIEEGYDDETSALLAQQYMVENGLSLDDIFEANLDTEKEDALTHFLAGSINLTDEDIRLVYDQLVATDKEYYTQYPDEFAFDALFADAPAAYVPEGYRKMQLILVAFDEFTMQEYDELYNDGEGYGEAAARLFEAIRPEAEQVYQRLDSGEEFEALMNEYPATDYLGDMGGEEGFYMGEGFDLLDEEALSAAWALEKPGEYTRPVRTPWGWAIIRYLGDVESGPIALEELYDDVYLMAYEDKLGTLRDAAMERLREEMGLKFFFERLG